MTTVTSISRHRRAKPVTTAEVLDACEAAMATTKAIEGDLVELIVKHMRHLMNLTTIPAAPARPLTCARTCRRARSCRSA